MNRTLAELTAVLAAICTVWMFDARTCRVLLVGAIAAVFVLRNVSRLRGSHG
jgi:hypothetical protein